MLSFRRLALAAVVLAAIASPSRADSDAEEIIAKSVKFLLSKQSEDGSWGVPGKGGEIGFTGLIAKGLHESGHKDAGPAVEKAVAWMLKQQQADGSFNAEVGGLATYRTAIAVLALASIDRAKHAGAIEKAKKWLEHAQFDDGEKINKDSPHWGGWGYNDKGDKPDADMSNAQWAIMALKEAGVGKDDPVMQRAIEFVSRCQNNTETNKGSSAEVKVKPSNDGGFFYGPHRATAPQTKIENSDGSVTYESYGSMTYAGLTSLIYAGMDPKDPRVKAALGWIKEHYTVEENYGLGVRADAKKGQSSQQALYYYYLTFARALDGLGSAEVETKDGKKNWAKDLVGALKARQKADGSFQNTAERWMEANPVLATAYALGAANLCEKHLKK